MESPTIISSQTVLSTDLFTVEKDEVQLPSGKILTHNNITRHPTITVFPLTEKYELFLVSQYRYMYGKRMLEAISGFVDKGETILSAAIRELQEEAGIQATQLEEFARIHLGGSLIKTEAHLFIAREFAIGKASPTEDEDIQLIKLPLSEAVKKVMLGEITIATTIAGILMLDKLKSQKRL